MMDSVLLIAARTQEGLLEALAKRTSVIDPEGGYRFAMLRPTEERLLKAEKIVQKGKSCQGMQDIWYSPKGLLFEGGKIGFMYPGVDSLAKPDVSDVSQRFGYALRRDPMDDDTIENKGAQVFYISDLYTHVLIKKLGIKPDLMFGHSMGEWSGLSACGLTGEQTVEEVVSSLQPGMLPVPGVVFVALGCSVDAALEAIEGLPDIQVSHDNCPHQSILCGIEESADKAIAYLSAKKVICHKLNFRSGFHTSLFKDYVGPLEATFRSMLLGKQNYPLWSATTCAPYPEDDAALRDLLIQHVLEPVRFRELTQTLYEQGVRVFVQVGAGSLPGFVDDTLRGMPHLCISTAASNRSSLAQLQKTCLSLFTEGANFQLDFLLETAVDPVVVTADIPGAVAPAATPAPAAAAPVTRNLHLVRDHEPSPQSIASVSLKDEIFAELQACFADIQSATSEIAAAMETHEPFSRRSNRILSLEQRPELMDHCFYPQKKGWKNLWDRFPVMPMTASIDLVIQAAREAFPERPVIAVESISATKWLAVEEPRSLDVELTFDGKNRIKVEIHGHFAATVVFGHKYPAAPDAVFKPLTNKRASTIAAKTVYDEGWLFHGPLYQCLADFTEVGDNGITGTIRATNVPGALLDNVGQLAGIWIMQALPIDRQAMPIRIKRISFFGPQPTSGEVTCQVITERIRSRDIMFSMEISANGKVWAKIEGWEKWRFESDEKHWAFLKNPGLKLLSDHTEGFTCFERSHLSDAACYDLSKRYLREAERKVYDSLGNKRNEWICGRVAAKDAIRQYLWDKGYPHEIFPAEIWIENDELGRPVISELPGSTPLSISIAHKTGMGVAIVSERSDIGVDVEKIEPRETHFETTVFSAKERAIIPQNERAEWITRFWSAKEAFAKSTGRGLEGNPHKFAIEEIRPEGIRINQSWVRSTKFGSYIISQKKG